MITYSLTAHKVRCSSNNNKKYI